MKRRKKILVACALLTLIVVAYFGIFWFTPNVDYWLDPNYAFQKNNNGWTTVNLQTNYSVPGTLMPINCKNNGLLEVAFDITVVFSGASISSDTSMPYQRINETAAKFSFILGGFEEKNSNIYFSITNNSRFTTSLSVSSNQQLLHITPAQKSSQPWDRSYRELFYSSIDNRFVAAIIN